MQLLNDSTRWQVEAWRGSDLRKDMANMLEELGHNLRSSGLLKPLCPSPQDCEGLKPVVETTAVTGFHTV